MAKSSPNSRKRVVLLGATGSIGESTLRVIAAHPDKLELVGVAARQDRAKLGEIAKAHRVPHVGLFNDEACMAAKASGSFDPGTHFHNGMAGLIELAQLTEADIVLVAIVGTTALAPTLAAIAQEKTIALASKEILVLAGKFVMAAAKTHGVQLRPVDSEHNAVFQCIDGQPHKGVKRIMLTASGGAFRDWPAGQLSQVTPADALKHPNWAMGPKITVDSATLANKGLELIEAQCLFDLRPAQCEAVLHPQSIVHCLVEYQDGAVLAQLCPPSMTFAIQHALLYPDRVPGVEAPLDFTQALSLDFQPVDMIRFPMLRLAKESMVNGGSAPAIFNAANEIAVAAFLDEQIPFLAIPSIVDSTLQLINHQEPADLATVLSCDAEARRIAQAQLPNFKS